MEEQISKEEIDSCLDAIGVKNTEFISKEDFEKTYTKTMDIDVYDDSDSYKIGTLTTKWLDVDNLQDEDNLHSL